MERGQQGQQGQNKMERGQQGFVRRNSEYRNYPRYTEEDTQFYCPCPIGGVRQPETRNVDNKNWTMEIDVNDFTPEEIKTKIDPVFHTVTITGKRLVNRRREDICPNTFKRVLPLPENIDITQLKCVVTTEGNMVLRAPFVNSRNEHETEIPITFKENSTLDNLTLEDLKTKIPVAQYLRLLKSFTFPGTTDAQCMRDEITGGFKIMIDLDTVGYRSHEVTVQFQERERRLAIVAKHEMITLGCNMFRREFIVPDYINMNQMQWRLLNNGILRIEMPCERNPVERKTAKKICSTY